MFLIHLKIMERWEEHKSWRHSFKNIDTFLHLIFFEQFEVNGKQEIPSFFSSLCMYLSHYMHISSHEHKT